MEGFPDDGGCEVALTGTGESKGPPHVMNEALDVDREGYRTIGESQEGPETIIVGRPLRGLETDQLLNRFLAQEPDLATGEGSLGATFVDWIPVFNRHLVSDGGGHHFDPGTLGSVFPFLLYHLHELSSDGGGLG